MWFVRSLPAIVICISLSYCAGYKSDYQKFLDKDCKNSYSTKCLKLDLVSWVEKLNENGNFSVYPGISIVRENGTTKANKGDIIAELAKDFPNDPDARLDAFLVKKLRDFMNTHSLRLEMAGNRNKEDGVVSGRKKGDDGGGGGHSGLIAIGGMMGSGVFALALAGLAALAGKALMTALISLLLSAIAGLKGGGGGGKTTYEVIAKPVHTYSTSHSAGHEDYHAGHGYKRSIDYLSLPLAMQNHLKPE